MKGSTMPNAVLKYALVIGILLSADSALAQAPVDFRISPSLRTSFLPDSRYDKALVVTVKDSTGQLLGNATVDATVTSDSTASVELFTNIAASGATTARVSTDARGLAVFGIVTKKLAENIAEQKFEILVRVNAAGAAAPREAMVQGVIFAKPQQALGSDRLSFELFAGTTLARAYDEEGKSTGFDEASPVGRLRFDTLWGRNRPLAFHTGFELQFSSFPTVAAADDEGGGGNGGGNGNGETIPKFTDFADSYTGSLVLIYQPGSAWTHSYSDTSHNSNPRLHYDAIRHGITARASVISRDVRAENDDTDIFSARLGYLFTHHQTAASEATYDDVNVFPMRFVEISYAYYESLFGRENADRLIVEAGLRVPGLGTDAIPFYGGVYLNAGKGQDDFRVFAGFLFQIDRIRQGF